MWSTLFIIDPLYTLPLLVGMIAILARPTGRFAARALSTSLVFSTLYLGWSWTAKAIVENKVASVLNGSGGRVLTTPAPFNTLVWRILVVEDDTYKEGYYSVLAPNRSIEFAEHDKNLALIKAADHLAAVDRLQWFSHGFIKGSMREDYLVITDLRMGVEGSYVFNHAVASKPSESFEPIVSRQLPQSFSGEDISRLWEQIKAMH
jgi:inner membrane protein